MTTPREFALLAPYGRSAVKGELSRRPTRRAVVGSCRDQQFAVIFDLDGLLADTEPLWTESARRLLAVRGHRYDPALKAQTMGRHPREVIAIYAARYGLAEDHAVLLEERLAILRDLYAQGVQPLPGARELVRALAAAGVPRAVASSSPASLIALVLERLGLADALEVRVGSEEVTRGKPDPDIFLLAARRLGASPGRCVVLEDSPAGVAAALAAGARCVAVPGPFTAPAAVAGADLVVSSLLELSPARLRELLDSPRS